MSYLNRPNRIYVSSDDSLVSTEHSGHFNITLNEPIFDAKTVSVVSCEYPNSFYNIGETDTFFFDEVYRDDGDEIKRIRFSLNGISQDNYTSAELATAISTRISYLTTNPVLVGIDQNPFSYSTEGYEANDTTIVGQVTPTGNTTSLGVSTMFIKQVVSASSTAPTRFRRLRVQIGVGTFSLSSFVTVFLLQKVGSIFKLIMTAELNYDTYDPISRYCTIDLFDKKVDITSSSGDFFIGVIVPPNGPLLEKVSGTESAFVNFQSTVGNLEEITSRVVSGNNVTLHDVNLTYTPVDNAALEPNFYVETTKNYNYNYNVNNASNYLKATLTLTHDDSTKRFSILPSKHASYTLFNGNAGNANQIPFYKNVHQFGINGYTNAAGTLVSSLEIPILNKDKNSINFKIGARSHKITNIINSNLATNTALEFVSIPRLIKYPYVFLVCDFVNDSKKTGTTNNNILQKLPLTSDYGFTNFFNVSSSDSTLSCTVNRDNIQSMNFRILDPDNNEINLNGGEVSFTLNFEY
jgi:hypothetical protein